MKVGIVAENFFPTLGGIQEHVRHLRNFLVRRGVDVTVLTGAPTVTMRTPVPRDANERVVRVGRARRYGTGGTFTQATIGPRVAWRLKRLLDEHAFDVLDVHGPCDFGLPLLATAMFRGPKVLTLHSCFPHKAWRRPLSPVYRWVFRQATDVVAVSAATRDSMRRYAKFDAHVVPNGVDVDEWTRGRPNARYLAPGLRNLVYLGRLEHRNGPDLLLEAFPHVLRACPDVRLLVAGDGPDREACERRVPHAIRDRVVFLGALYDERPDLLASSSLFLLPARAVGFSILVLEAFASGLPVVALPALGTDRAGDHWSNVLLSDDATPASFARAIVSALSADHAQRIERGRAIARAHDWSHVGPRILEILERACTKRSG